MYKPHIGKYVLIKSTKDDMGFIELEVGNLKKIKENLKEYERYQQESSGMDAGETVLMELADGFKMRRRDEDWHSVNVSDSRRRGRVDGIYGRTNEQFDRAEGSTEIGGDNNEGVIYFEQFAEVANIYWSNNEANLDNFNVSECTHSTDAGGNRDTFYRLGSASGKKRKTRYNEYNTNGMQWEYNVSTSVGDRRILYKPSAGKYALIKATKEDVGFIELMLGTRKQVEEELEVYERNKEQSAGLDSSETTSVGWANTFELQQGDEGWYTGNVRNSKGRERVDDIHGGRVSKELVDGTESASEVGRDSVRSIKKERDQDYLDAVNRGDT